MQDKRAIWRQLMRHERFPRSSKYDPEWMIRNAMGPNPLWLMEWLCERMRLEPGMRVLDMGCGRATSSIFLAREYGVQVWANDLWISASENWTRIKEAGVEDLVFPIHAEARTLPYAEGFFDAALSVDSYHYYGTDDLYVITFAGLVKPGGALGIVVPGLTRDFEDGLPDYLGHPQSAGNVFWAEDCWSFHTAAWWRHHWARHNIVEDVYADTLEDGWKHWLRHEQAFALLDEKPFPDDAEVLEADQGDYLGFIRMTATVKP